MQLKPNQIFIEMLPDGSWEGKMNKFGGIVEVREVKPEDVLLKLLTHSGE